MVINKNCTIAGRQCTYYHRISCNALVDWYLPTCVLKSCGNLLVSTSYTCAQKLIAEHFSARQITLGVRWAVVGS